MPLVFFSLIVMDFSNPVQTVYELLKSKPEQERRLLSTLVNKVSAEPSSVHHFTLDGRRNVRYVTAWENCHHWLLLDGRGYY